MTSSKDCDGASMIFNLCSHLTKQKDESLNSTYRFALRALNSSPLTFDYDEFVTLEKIKKKLVRQGGQRDAIIFSDLYRKLQNCKIISNTGSVLTFLYSLHGSDKQHEKYAQFASELARVVAALPDISLHANDIIRTKPLHTTSHVSKTEILNDSHIQSRKLSDRTKILTASEVLTKKSESKHTHWSQVKTSQNEVIKVSKYENEKINLVYQKDIMCDILYIVQGITGKIINGRRDLKKFSVSMNDNVSNMNQKLILRFAEMGWMLTKINCFCEEHGSDKSLGLIGQSFIASLKTELLEFYKILAVLQSQLQNDTEFNDAKIVVPLTLHRLSFWFIEPFLCLQLLASVVDASIGKKGGALTSVLFAHLQHGNHCIREPVKRLLLTTVQPLYKMLSNWIFRGELEDVFGEFFVIENTTFLNSNMWQEKYSLNKAMIPSFLTMEQAKKILSTGKALNFLCEICRDRSFVRSNQALKKIHDDKKMESLFLQENESEFHLIVEKNYKKTSNLVLKVLHNEYKLMSHFQAMRNYFLLGQGDFIRHIMDLLEPDLNKPASMLHEHVLSGILDSAIRATNAQYHEPEILQRLCVNLLEFSADDTGWDVFTLKYHVDGPIATVFTANCMMSYLRIFKSLWRAKQMEYILSNIFQSRAMYLKIQKKFPVVAPISFKCNIALSQMVHFVQQMQYYNAFEVMECCWADLLQKIEQSKDLDEIISAHEIFLDTLLKRSFLTEESTDLQAQLKAIYNMIVKFQNWECDFWSQAQKLWRLSEEEDMKVREKTKSGKWGTTELHSKTYHDMLETFSRNIIPSAKGSIRVIIHGYEQLVQKFLLMLNDHEDQNLRFLSFRLDFNEHFKSRYSALHSSLTYLHRRQSLK